MPYQVPKANHPWRNWVGPRDQSKTESVLPKEEKKSNGLKPIQVFLTEITQSWDTVEITTFSYGREGRYKLSELPQDKIAAWLSGLLRRNYYAG